MTGDLAGAERHLAALKEICLLPCEELRDLERDCGVPEQEIAPVENRVFLSSRRSVHCSMIAFGTRPITAARALVAFRKP
jgi:hypothetical protein